MSEQPFVKELKKSSLFKEAAQIAEVLNKAGFRALLAGGAVRDALLKRPIKDLDIATSALPDEVEHLFPNSIAIGKSFGVIGVKSNHHLFEVATFRTDGDYKDGRRPTSVRFSTLLEDAQRRDFTINALYFDFETGGLIDLVSGQIDLKNKILRTVGEAKKRFGEDHLRILRALRFESVLDFKIEDQTLSAIFEQAHLLEKIAKERITAEFEKLLLGEAFLRTLKVTQDSGIFKIMTGKALPNETWRRLAFTNPDLISRLSALVWNQDLKQFFKNFRFSNEIVKSVARSIELAHTLQNNRRGEQLKALGEPMGLQALSLLSSVRMSESQSLDDLAPLVDMLNQWDQILPSPFLTSEDLSGLNIKPGPIFGQILSSCFVEQLEGKINSKAEALKFASEWDPHSF